ETEMWVHRKFKHLNRAFGDSNADERAYFGRSGATVRLGRATSVRGLTNSEYDEWKARSKGPVGPYLPLILEACGETEYAYEYRHGVSSYGAFTYSLASILRDAGKKNKTPTFSELAELTKKRLKSLGYEQTPGILGPGSVMSAEIPWRA
ncbi:MAG: caspase family protein, partial [Pseudomonadota bacterium]